MSLLVQKAYLYVILLVQLRENNGFKSTGINLI